MPQRRVAKGAGLTASEERFCLALIEPGLSQAESYRRAFPKSKKWKDESVWVKASQLASTDKVRIRVAELRKQIAEDGVIGAKEVVRELTKVAMAEAPIRGGDKVSALDKLMKHFGQYEKDNSQVADPLAALLERINGNVLKPGNRTDYDTDVKGIGPDAPNPLGSRLK